MDRMSPERPTARAVVQTLSRTGNVFHERAIKAIEEEAVHKAFVNSLSAEISTKN